MLSIIFPLMLAYRSKQLIRNTRQRVSFWRSRPLRENRNVMRHKKKLLNSGNNLEREKRTGRVVKELIVRCVQFGGLFVASFVLCAIQKVDRSLSPSIGNVIHELLFKIKIYLLFCIRAHFFVFFVFCRD